MVETKTNHHGVNLIIIERKVFGVAVLKLDAGIGSLREVYLRSCEVEAYRISTTLGCSRGVSASRTA
jgi:hypothetical protein